jgi:hypothetical protein
MRARGDKITLMHTQRIHSLSPKDVHNPWSHDSQPLRPSTTTVMSGYNPLFVLVIVAALMLTSWVFTPKGQNQT